ncbi:MAG: alpha/beta fold hydrolase, partial [Rhodothermales bacterium]|nr:alpha/beta fold hydrolase [Rhodothermales bacterium]
HPLLILHGLLGASGNWRTLSRNAFGERYRTITPDLRNHGRSPHSEEFSYDAMTADLIRLMDKLQVPSANFLGHSMGGKVAMHLALAFPDRVDRLIVADIAPRAYEPGHLHIFDALESIDPGQYSDRSAIDDALAEHLSSLSVRQFLLKNLTRDGESYAWKMNLKAIRAGYDDVIGAVSSGSRYEKPTLFVGGGNSHYVSERDLPHIRQLFPNAELVMMPGAGHWLHAEKPEDFSRIVMDWLPE